MDHPHPDHQISDRPRKGRGALSNRSGRFERDRRVLTDDGWGTHETDARPPMRTELRVDRSRSIITRNDSPDVPFDRSINPYKGCEHGCIYCFARPTHAYLGLSAGLDFETVLFHKPDAPQLLEAALRAPGYRVATLALGANTDPYQPVERSLGLTRQIIQVLARFQHPFGIVTKSALVQRDLDLLAPLASANLVQVCVSVTTLNPSLARTMEPRAAAPQRRLETIRVLSEAGLPVTVLASPMIPGLNDHELEAVLEAAAAAGAKAANTIMIRLPLEIAALFTEWLHGVVPRRADRVLRLIREVHRGALYRSQFGERMRGSGPIADLLWQRFARACRRLGLADRGWSLDSGRFTVPSAPSRQLQLFD